MLKLVAALLLALPASLHAAGVTATCSQDQVSILCSGVTGAGTSGEVAVYNGALTITSSPTFTYNGNTLSLTGSGTVLDATGKEVKAGTFTAVGSAFIVGGTTIQANDAAFAGTVEAAGQISAQQTGAFYSVVASSGIQFLASNTGVRWADGSISTTAASSAPIPGVSGTAGQVAYFNGSNSVISSTGMLFNGANFSVYGTTIGERNVTIAPTFSQTLGQGNVTITATGDPDPSTFNNIGGALTLRSGDSSGLNTGNNAYVYGGDGGNAGAGGNVILTGGASRAPTNNAAGAVLTSGGGSGADGGDGTFKAGDGVSIGTGGDSTIQGGHAAAGGTPGKAFVKSGHSFGATAVATLQASEFELLLATGAVKITGYTPLTQGLCLNSSGVLGACSGSDTLSGNGLNISSVTHHSHVGGFSTTLGVGTTFFAFIPDEAIKLERITATVVVAGVGGAGDTYRCQDASGNFVAVTVGAAATAGTVTTATGTGLVASGAQVNGLLFSSTAITSPVVNVVCEYSSQ